MQPKDRKTMQKATFRPVSREIVFDIDMTDYDEIRTCCSGKDICKRCWQFIAVAVEVLDATLRDDFGFRHLLWVYSGRRGIHCWISDEEAFSLPDEARKALVGWIEVIRGGHSQTKKVDLGFNAPGAPRTMHPSLRRAVGTNVLQASSPSAGAAMTAYQGPLQRVFIDLILRDQNCFAEQKQSDALISLLPGHDSDAIARLQNKWAAPRSSERKWEDVLDTARRVPDRMRPIWVAAIEDIILQYTYPRVDSEVSKRQNHLLKSPFVVHPSTGRVCVPLEPEHVRSFDPQTGAPTVAQLLRELNRHISESTDKSTRGEWEHTSLRPYVEQLDQLAARVMREARDAKRGESLLRASLTDAATTKHSLDF